MSQRKVLVIGIDAATLDLVRPWASAGHLPNLDSFLQHGAVGPLRSTLPVSSPAAWSTFVTGLNPGKHGIISFRQFEPDSYAPHFANASHRRGAAFWEIAGRFGVRGGVINVPITYPPRPYEGFIVSGMLSPGVNRHMASPPEIFDDLMAVSPDYVVDVDMIGSGQMSPARLIERALGAVKARRDAAVGLYRKHKPPLFCAVFTIADRICHYLWNYCEALERGDADTELERGLGQGILQIYEKLDEAVGELMAEAGDDADVVILSDHGAGPSRKGLSLHRLLAREGLLAESRGRGFIRLAKRAVWAVAGLTPLSIKNQIKLRLPKVAKYIAGTVSSKGIDFSSTLVYPIPCSGGLFVNLRGRQPRGIVEPEGDYEAVRDRLIRIFSELKDPETGRPVIRRVWRREEAWSGPCIDRLPDMIVELEDESFDMGEIAELSHAKDVFFQLPVPTIHRVEMTGSHRRDGIFMAMGPQIRQTEIRGASIADVPATVLALLGCPIPEQFDGRVLKEALTDDVDIPGRCGEEAAGEAPAAREFSETDQEIIANRLKELGYM